jgi:hypothetical protein
MRCIGAHEHPHARACVFIGRIQLRLQQQQQPVRSKDAGLVAPYVLIGAGKGRDLAGSATTTWPRCCSGTHPPSAADCANSNPGGDSHLTVVQVGIPPHYGPSGNAT